jgi:hypothetical protein
MTELARPSRNCKRQTHPLVREVVNIETITASVQFEKKNTGRVSQGAWRQDELIGGKPPVVK